MSKEEEIIEATIENVAKNGLVNISMKEVVSNVNCSSALVYKYFDSVDALIRRCCETVAQRHIGILKEIMDTVSFTGNLRDGDEKLNFLYLKKCSERPNDFLFKNALKGTKYEGYTSNLDNHSNDPLFQGLLRYKGWTVDTIPLNAHISYDCTMMALEMVMGVLFDGTVPNTDEELHKIAKMFAYGLVPMLRWKIRQ